MNTPVSGQVSCTHSAGIPVTLALQGYQAVVAGPFNGKLVFDAPTGGFTYTPGFYPADPTTGVQDVMPDYTGEDSFLVNASATDGASLQTIVNLDIDPAAASCDPGLVAQTQTMFNNPAGSEAEQYQMVRHLVAMINCVPAANDDGTQASIKFTFYSMTYAPIQAALVNAANRGVSVQVLTNSQADKYTAWKLLEKSLGTNVSAGNFAVTCWQGCLTPRTGPTAGGPTAWYDADATTTTSLDVVFKDRSFPGNSPIVSWRWGFGDGATATGPGPHAHHYKAAGNYLTSLVVTDAAGLTHRMTGEKAMPDETEPMYPSLHSKIYLFSQVGTGSNARTWVSAYSSGNPTYQQSRKGFNNLNIAVNDKALYDIFGTYFHDLVSASTGHVMTTNYFRSFSSPGNPATAAPATTVHLGPQTSGDINRDIVQSIKCRFQDASGKWQRTKITISVFVFTRTGLSRDLWRLAYEQGCDIDIVYTQMSQRIKGSNGQWLENEDGEPTGYGVADCLSTPPTRKVGKKTVINTLGGPTAANPGAPYCNKTSLKGKVPVSKSGVWLNKTSPITGGRIRVQMSCPVAPYYDTLKKLWSVVCIRNDIFTHHKVMLVDGMIHGAQQKYILTGSSNFSSPGLRGSDEVITEIQGAPTLYNQYLVALNGLKSVIAKNTASTPSAGNKPKDKKKKKVKKSSIMTFSLKSGQQLDVRGMTDEDLGMDKG
ncbi:MAG: phospholipase D-like domain-containing protein [Candidatus Nanopelagicales bacterium]